MGRIIRRTVTITMSESWKIVWTNEDRADDKLQAQVTTIMQDQPKMQEEPDETILPAVTTGAGTDTQPTNVSPKSGAGSQRKHRRRCAAK